MVKIDDLLRNEGGSTTVKGRILQYLEEHEDEVLPYNDKEEFKNAFPNDNINSINWALWTLGNEKKIGKARLGRKVYFGSHKAIEELKRRKK